MTTALFRVDLPSEEDRLAAGDPHGGPRRLLPAGASLDAILTGAGPSLEEALAAAEDPVPEGAVALAPIGTQEVWAAGVTYLRSRDARVEEAEDPTPYDLAYEAERPELFCKCPGWRVRGPGQPVGVRRDSTWDVPEPEVALVLDATLRVAGYTIGNDVSSRSIEGENPLYLPQAKTYEGSCALGPCIVPATEVAPPFHISMRIRREGRTVFAGAAGTDQMRRGFDELAAHLGRALRFPPGVVLLTGTGIVPDPPFTLRPGDVVRIDVEGLGSLENPVELVG